MICKYYRLKIRVFPTLCKDNKKSTDYRQLTAVFFKKKRRHFFMTSLNP